MSLLLVKPLLCFVYFISDIETTKGCSILIVRLLSIQDDGELILTEYTGLEIPPYAILSHRWGPDSEEVSFQDISGLTTAYKNKKGFEKILRRGEQAKKDGWDYFWVDTCAIDKSSSAELSESINTMRLWYSNAEVCYAYLDDVTIDENWESTQTSLKASVWFRRGWTLQELLAPSKVVLYDQSWSMIGTKADIAELLSTIVGIPAYHLVGWPAIREASIAQKISWAANGVTKRPEDTAYCLLGLCDINMLLVYGEGPKAFRRLQEDIMKVFRR